MKGFEISVNGKTYYAAIEEGAASVIFSGRNNMFYLSAGGLENKSGKNLTWYYSDISPETKIIVRIKEITNTSPLIPKWTKEEINAWKIKEYKALKNALSCENYLPMGIEMIFQGQKIGATIKSGKLAVVITSSKHGLKLLFSGFDNHTLEHKRWFFSSLQLNDEICMQTKIIDCNSPCIECHSDYSPHLSDKELLEKQRKELLISGIIGKDE